MAGAGKMSEQNEGATEGTFTADVLFQGADKYDFDTKDVSIKDRGDRWLVSADYLGDDGILLWIDFSIAKSALPPGETKLFKLDEKDLREAYGKLGRLPIDMLAKSGWVKITYAESTKNMTGTFEFVASDGSFDSSVKSGAFSLTGLDPSVQDSGSVTAEISSEEPKEFVSTTVKLSKQDAPLAWWCWAEQLIPFPFHRSTLTVSLAEGITPGTYDFDKDKDKISAIYTKITPAGSSYNATEGQLVLTTGPAKNEMAATFSFKAKSIDESLPSIEVTNGTMNIRARKNQ
jgi:hypothetical protein